MALGSNTTYIAKAGVPKFTEQNAWTHLLITLDDGFIEFYIDGNPVPGGIKSLKGEAIINGPGTLRVGAGLKGRSRYAGMLQDVRIYGQKLSLSETAELHATPAKTDLHPVSGYLEYRQGETHKSFIVSARDDDEEEGEEVFILKLISVYGGARLPEGNTTALIHIQKSDNANGLFGFTGPCIPESSEEGSTISCVVERTRGALDTVYLFYVISQTNSVNANDSVKDFISNSGNITFLPLQRTKVLNLNVLDDDIPELTEHFKVTLVSAIAADGKVGSTPTSGASIDPSKDSQLITINASDHPYGLLQFSTEKQPKPGDAMTIPAKTIPTIAVKEEIGQVKLLVVRAQGLLGRIQVEYRTVSQTAISPKDFQETRGYLEFQPGERYKYITVNITDNSVPELAKSFRVELLNSNGGVAELFRNDDSGSGDGDWEIFLPAVHQRASLGVASHIIVTIEGSDDAHGVFEFSTDSLYVTATEPEYGYGNVTLQVLRDQGALSKVSVCWTIEFDPVGDLAITDGNITFDIGQKRANITILISADDTPELDKMFSILITNVSSGRLGGRTNATLTIFANDDPYGIFIFSESNRPIRVEEKDTNITLIIRRSKGLMSTVMVAYRTINDSQKLLLFPSNIARATQGRDYIPISGNVLFRANVSEEIVFLPILDDNDPERAESLFVELFNVTLVEKVQNRAVFDSPRLGPKIETIAHIIINASDAAFGVLQLSTTYVRIAESYVGPIINVTRTGGVFADVSVKFKAVPITATAGEDYSVASSDVVLLEGETSKAMPIYIINDINPEVEESFQILLLNQTTGGAMIGGMTEAIVVIEASDDPYGSFVFQVTSLTVEEPEFGPVKVNLPIIRNSGTLGNVTLQWVSTIHGKIATDDLKVAAGNVTFAAGETIQTLSLEILPDDIPEIEEVVHVQLTYASNGGSIGSDGIAKIIIPANDKPYGTIFFHRPSYRFQEPLEKSSFANITIRRSAGRFGHLQILYTTSEIDVIGLAVEQGQNMISYYESPLPGAPWASTRTTVNISVAGNPLQYCALVCLRNKVCSAFTYENASGKPQCFWVTTLSDQLSSNTQFQTYRKNSTSVSVLFSSQATAGSDYETVTGQWFTMLEGEEFANLTVSILTDTFPELDERFIVSLLEVKLLNISTSLKNQPTIGQPNTTVAVIMMNGDAFGVFVIYTLHPSAGAGGHYVEIEELAQTLQLVVERKEGSLGQVMVEWSIVGGTATKNMDFRTDEGLLTFAEGETRKVVILFILDDLEPEETENIIFRLTQTEGGSRILPSSDTVTIMILANDNVAGLISFQATSRSVIGREGEKLQFHVLRTPPGKGNVTVHWKITGHRQDLNFENSTGLLYFQEGLLNTSFVVHLLDDHIPEEKEEYQIILYNVSTQGVSGSGAAALDKQGYEAILTVEASDEPHGVLNFAPSSRMVVTEEGNKTIQLFINREYGSLGDINITYITALNPLNQTSQIHPAEPGVDYIATSGSLIIKDGETTAAINVTILEDDVPELQEYIFVTLVSVELTVKLITSSPPKLDAEGLTAQIIIDANDGVQGVIEWQRTSYEVNETQGILTLVAYRNKGTHGNVSLFFYAQNLGAQLGMDYNATATILTFVDGEKYKFIDISIHDDDIPEGNESFQLILANPSLGLELGSNTTVTVTILANDDGHGILYFNNSELFYLREPTALYMTESVAMLYIVRDPPQGIFGTVTVQYIVSGENSSDAEGDLSPTQGYVVLEEGERFKTLEISAVLDEEPELDEHFTVTLFNPTGGARLGTRTQTMITVLQNQAPQGLFSIFPITNRTSSVTVEEGNVTVFLKVSRNNGLNMSVSVEWETLSGSALGIKGPNAVLSVLQRFQNTSASSWCLFNYDDFLYGILLRALPINSSTNSLFTIYEWRGVFVPIQDVAVEVPHSCAAFKINGSQLLLITSRGTRLSNNSLYTFTPKSGLSMIQMITLPETSGVRYFTNTNQVYLIITSNVNVPETSQVFKWSNNIFTPHQKLPISGASGLTVFTRGGITHLVVCLVGYDQYPVLYTWTNNQFDGPREVGIKGATSVESLVSGADVFIFFSQAENSLIHVFLWEAGQISFKKIQTIFFEALSMIHAFTPPSGLVHILLASEKGSAIYSLNANQVQFSMVLMAPATKYMSSASVKSLNSSKTIVAQVSDFNAQISELTSVSNQSDFIPSSGELKFEPGQSEAVFAVNILDDSIPEEDESFRIRLKNPKGGAEIGANNLVTVIIPTNDDAHGIVAFSQNSLMKQAEEMDQDNLISFSIERQRGLFGRVVVEWFANGSITDIFPSSGVVTFSDGQALTTITVTIVADNIAELTETVTVTLTKAITMNIKDPKRGATIDPQKSKAVLIILPNDSPHGVVGWRLDALPVIVEEPTGNSTVLTLHLTREQGFAGDIAVYIEAKQNLSLPTVNRATENQDFTIKGKVITIKENKTSALVTVVILPDDIPELNEGFLLNITDVQFINSSTASGLPSLKRPGAEIVEVIILENDEPRGIFQFNVSKDPSGAVTGFEVPPPQNVLRLPVIRLAGRYGSVSVYWEANPITASQDDFTPSSGNITFSDGEALGVIEIFIVDDTVIEYLESFRVSLKRLTNGAKFGNETSVIVNIPANDSPLGLFGFTEKMVFVSELLSSDGQLGQVNLTVARSPGGHGSVKIIWIIEEAAQHDLHPLNGTLMFNESDTRKSFTLQAIQDGLLEGEEKYSIQLVSIDYSVISPVDGTATIVITGDVGASGVVGIDPSYHNVLIGEPSGYYNGTAHIRLVRGPGIFGEVTIYWNITPARLNEFVELSGALTMRDMQSAAVVIIQAMDDHIPEEKSYYVFQLSKISEGGSINESSRLVNITMASSDQPYGHFEFSQSLLQTAEDEKWINVTVVRSSGRYGEVHVTYGSLDGSALYDLDFANASGTLIFRPNEAIKSLLIEIKNDIIPEGPEDFFVVLTEVKLVGRDFDHTVRENGLQIDQPPTIGNNSVVRIIILKNDNAEGIIQFDSKFTDIEVEEDIGEILIPVVRLQGTYGYVTADFITHGISAMPDGIDYRISNNTVGFQHGQSLGFISVLITDDEESEYSEQFEIRLVGASGGAVLGQHLVSLITIAKSDSLNGAVRFLNQSQITLPNPNVSLSLSLVLERTGGSLGEVQILWNILGPNSNEILPINNDDFGEPLNGSFYFNDGESGTRTIYLTVLPHGEIEVQEKFTIKLTVASGGTEIDPKTGNVTLIIKKFGDPNGIVQFADDPLLVKRYSEPEAHEGPKNITLLVKRIQGTLGNLTVHWLLSSVSDIVGDFTATSGSVFIPDKERTGEILIQLLPDDVPEVDEQYMVQLTYVEGGADLDSTRARVYFTVLANDEPHGVFTVYSAGQSIILDSDLSRHVLVNVTRLAGTFGNVSVAYQISFAQEPQENLTETLTGRVLVKDGASYGVSSVPISSQIGFESMVFHLTNITTGRGYIVISRKGTYGSITVSWRSGFPTHFKPQAVSLGKIEPESGDVVLFHGEDRKIIPVHLMTNTTGPEMFAVQLTDVKSNVSGGARLRQGFISAEFEPMGVFQLSTESLNVAVEEDAKTVRLHVQRLFGFRGNQTRLYFQTVAGSAKAVEDYLPIYAGELIFEKYQTKAVIDISIINDNIYEPNESFYLNLTSVESVHVYDEKPRLHLDASLSTITILANDLISGFLSIGPTVIYVDEEANNSAVNVVTVHVKRTRGLSGVIHITLRTFGSINAQNGLKGLPFEHHHVSSNISWATEGLDFEEKSVFITLRDGESENTVSFKIHDDEEPEGLEVFYVFLKDPQGGAQIADGRDEMGYASFSAIIIQGNDMQNGIIGFTMESLDGLTLDEDSVLRTTRLVVSRQKNRAFEDVKVYWRATFNKTSVELYREEVNLVNELQAVSGYTICIAGQTECIITVEIKPDKVPEYETFFFVELYEVGAGASINSSTRFAKIIILESDSPYGLIYFAVGSRVAVAHKKTTLISLQISREASTSQPVSVGYVIQELKNAETVGHTLISPAIPGRDYVKSDGRLTFESGQRNIVLDVTLTPETGSLNPFPKRFQVILTEPSGGAIVDALYGIANITILSDSLSQSTWGLIDQLYQPYNEDVINRVLQTLNSKVGVEVSEEQLGAMINILEKVHSCLINIYMMVLYNLIYSEHLCDMSGQSLLSLLHNKYRVKTYCICFMNDQETLSP
uniref:Adhesion G protein-coupled receptor V1 n=1 Tax=Leptobrachium leishanense TaxID=445787 RepID=A0A8C5LUA9_9ANUR